MSDPLEDVVKQELAPGIWVDGNDNLHFDYQVICQALNFPNTPAFHLMIEEELMNVMKDIGHQNFCLLHRGPPKKTQN